MKGNLILDTKDLSESFVDAKTILKEYDNILTSIDYNNDIELKVKDKTVFSKIQTIENFDITYEFHKLSLGKDPEHVFISGKSDIKKCENLEYKYKIDGLYDVTKVEEIDTFYDVFSCYPVYVILSICPRKFPHTIIKFCKENDIKIIATDIYGGKYNETWMIDMFTRSFLTEFGLYNSDYITLDCKDYYKMRQSIESWKKWKSKEKIEEKNYSLSSDVDSLPLSEPKKLIHGYYDFSLGDTLKISNLEVLDRNKTCNSFLREEEISVYHKDSKKDILLNKFLDNYNITFPSDIELNHNNLCAYLRYYSSPILDDLFSRKTFKKSYNFFNGFIAVLFTAKGLSGLLARNHVILIYWKDKMRAVKLTRKEIIEFLK